MIKDITIGQYIPGKSYIHKLDPRTKIMITLLFVIDLFVINKFYGYIFIFLFLGTAVALSKVPVRYLYNGLKPILILIVITAIFNIFMIKGTPNSLLFHFKFISIYKEGLVTAGFMALRLIFLVAGTSLLTLTTSPIELTDGMEYLLRPIGRELSHELAMMMTIALRFIPTLIDETDKIMKAQKARGADFDTGGIIKLSLIHI